MSTPHTTDTINWAGQVIDPNGWTITRFHDGHIARVQGDVNGWAFDVDTNGWINGFTQRHRIFAAASTNEVRAFLQTGGGTSKGMNSNMLLRQIGDMNVLAISGGRVEIRYVGTVTDAVAAVILPVRYGYAVEITLEADDTYTVARTFTRSGVTTTKAVRYGVYADQVGDVAYRASCYRDAL